MRRFFLLGLVACEPLVDPVVESCEPGDTTWDSWGAGFFGSYCRSCHSSSTPDRRGAPEGVDFDTEAQVLANLEGVHRSVLTEGTMPRGGGVPDVELERLRAYLACGDGAAVYDVPVLIPVTTVAEVEADLDTVLTQGLFFPFELHRWFDQLLDDADGAALGCPRRDRSADDEADWTLYWSGFCDTGVRELAGDVIADVRSDVGESTSMQAWDLFSLTGTDLGTGGAIVAGGNTTFSWSVLPGAAQFNTFIGGRYHDPGSEGPLAFQQSAGLTIDGLYGGRDGLVATVSGGLSVGEATVDFREISLTSACAGPSGVIGVRDAGSGWWALTLSDDCSGCGPLSFEGTDYGSSCAGLILAERLKADVLAAVADFP